MPSKPDEFFESLYKENFHMLKLQARSWIHNPSVAEELVQDTFCTAWQKYEDVLRHENPKAFLKTMLRYKISEYNRARQRDLKLFRSLERTPLPEGNTLLNSTPTSTSSILETVRDTLDETEWYILEQFSMRGASHLQIAKALDITPSASQKRLERIRKKLEDVLPDY